MKVEAGALRWLVTQGEEKGFMWSYSVIRRREGIHLTPAAASE